MSKTIEEAAREYERACDVTSENFDPSDIESAFVAGAQHVLSLPLSARLTEEEKRELRCRYHTNECVIKDHRKRCGDKAQTKAATRIKMLENIFGKEMFNESNQEK